MDNNLVPVPTQPLMGGLSAMSQAFGDTELSNDLQEISQIPGATEMLFTMAADELGPDKSQVIRLFGGGPVQKAEGGVADYAEVVREGGRGDDDVLLHVSPEEFEALQAMWGKAEINPITGLPEYGFLSKAWKKVKNAVKKIVKNPLFQVVAPVALNMFVPGLGAAVGGALGATGTAASTLGNALVRAGIGAAGGGSKGALMGALTAPGVGGTVGKALGMSGRMADVVGTGLLSGAGTKATGGEFQEGMLSGALGESIRPSLEGTIEKGLSKLPGVGKLAAATAGTPTASTGTATSATPIAQSIEAPTAISSELAGAPGGYAFPAEEVAQAAAQEGTGSLMDAAPLLLAAGAMSGGEYEAAPPEVEEGEILPQYTFERERYGAPSDLSRYGFGGEQLFFDPAYQFVEEGEEEEEDENGIGALDAYQEILGGQNYQQGGAVDEPVDYYTYGAPPQQMMQAPQGMPQGMPTGMLQGTPPQGMQAQPPAGAMMPPQGGLQQAAGQRPTMPQAAQAQAGGAAPQMDPQMLQQLIQRRAQQQQAGGLQMATGGIVPQVVRTTPEGYNLEGAENPLRRGSIRDALSALENGDTTTGSTTTLSDTSEKLYFPTDTTERGGTSRPGSTDDLTYEELLEIVPEDYDLGQGETFLRYKIANDPYWTSQFEEEAELTGINPMEGSPWAENILSGFGDISAEDIQAYIHQHQNKARGGEINNHFRGGGSGRDDLIDAKLSDGEFVMDAETVSLLGDGSNDEGARRLEEMRQNLRKHKGENLQSGKFSSDAKKPEEYLKSRKKRKRVAKKKRKGRDNVDEIVDIMSAQFGG